MESLAGKWMDESHWTPQQQQQQQQQEQHQKKGEEQEKKELSPHLGAAIAQGIFIFLFLFYFVVFVVFLVLFRRFPSFYFSDYKIMNYC